MSINKFQEKVFRTGCGSAVLYVCAAVFFGGMFYLGCGLGGGGNDKEGNGARAVAFEVGDTPVYNDVFADNLRNQRESMLQRMGKPEGAISPMDEAEIEGQVIDGFVTSMGNIYLAKKAGVKFTDQQITQSLERDVLESQITQERSMLVSQKKLKPDANAAEFDAALKKEKIPTVTDIKKQFHDNLDKDLKDEKLRPGLEEQVARTLLIAAIQATIKPSLEELKATYDTFQFKRILFAAHPNSTVDSQIAKAQADLKAGQSFEQVIDRYSSEPPIRGKKLSENTIPLSPSQFDMFPEYKALKPLKQGEVSGVIETPQGKAIYKLIGVKNSAPTDIASNTKKYLDMYAQQKAQTEYQDEIKKFTQSGQITWKNDGLKALYDWFQVRRDFMLPPAQQAAKMGGVIDEAKRAVKASGTDTRPAALAWFAAFDSLWTAPGADKAKLRADRIEVLKAVNTVEPFFSLRMELVDLLVDAKAIPEAIDTLKAAASSNFNYDIQGQQDYQDIQAHMIKLTDKGLLSKKDQADLAKIQQDWIKANEAAAQEKAAQKKAMDEAKKENDALIAKQKADKEKALKAAPASGKPAPGAPAPTPGKPTTPAATVTIPPKSGSAPTPAAPSKK